MFKSLKIFRSISQRSHRRYFYNNGLILFSKDVIPRTDQADSLVENIKSVTDTLDLFDVLSHHIKPLNSQQVMEALKSLFVLQRSGNSSVESSQILKHPQFEKICRNLKSASRSLELNEIIEALKVLSYIGVESNSEISYILLNMLRHQINDITLGHITFLHFLLNKFDRTPLIEALQIALPMVFQIHLSAQLDHENVPQLVDLLSFAVHNSVSDKCINSIVTALTLHGCNLRLDEAKSIIWSLCDMRNFKPNYDKLFANAITVVNNRYKEIGFDALETTLSKVSGKFINKSSIFYNEELFNNCAAFVIEKDLGFTRAAYVLKKLNKINFINIFLLDYMTEKIHRNSRSIVQARPSLYFNYVTGLSMANYCPKNWETVKEFVLQNPIIQSDKHELPWMKFNIELMSLNCHDRSLLEKVFNDDFLDRHLAREQNTLDYLQMLLLYQSVMTLTPGGYDGKLPSARFIDRAKEINLERRIFPLQNCFEVVFGGAECIHTGLITKLGHFIDHAIVFDKETQRPVPRSSTDGETRFIEDLRRDGHEVVAILAFPRSHFAVNIGRLKGMFDLRIRTLEALGLPVAYINLEQWHELPEPERLPFLEREVRFKLDCKNKSSVDQEINTNI